MFFLLVVVVVVVLKGIHFRSGTNRTGNEGLSFHYPRPLYSPDQMLAVMVLSQHRVSSSKTVRTRAPCGARCMGHVNHVNKTWSAICLAALHSQFGEGARPPFVHGRMELPNTSLQAIELDRSYSGRAHSNRLDTGPGYKNTKSGCILAMLRAPSIARPLTSADAKSGKAV